MFITYVSNIIFWQRYFFGILQNQERRETEHQRKTGRLRNSWGAMKHPGTPAEHPRNTNGTPT